MVGVVWMAGMVCKSVGYGMFDMTVCMVIRYVYSIDHVTCSTYVCICAAAILVLLATFELTE